MADGKEHVLTAVLEAKDEGFTETIRAATKELTEFNAALKETRKLLAELKKNPLVVTTRCEMDLNTFADNLTKMVKSQSPA